MYKDGIYDICLTAYGYLPIWKKFEFLNQAAEDQKKHDAFVELYDDIKNMTFIDYYKWGDFMLDSNPIDSWDEWVEECKEFFKNPDQYVDDLVEITSKHNWSKMNQDVPVVFPVYMKRFVYQMKICTLYDAVWPRVAFNYRTFELDAFVDKYMKKEILLNKEKYSVLPPVEWLDE